MRRRPPALPLCGLAPPARRVRSENRGSTAQPTSAVLSGGGWLHRTVRLDVLSAARRLRRCPGWVCPRGSLLSAWLRVRAGLCCSSASPVGRVRGAALPPGVGVEPECSLGAGPVLCALCVLGQRNRLPSRVWGDGAAPVGFSIDSRAAGCLGLLLEKCKSQQISVLTIYRSNHRQRNCNFGITDTRRETLKEKGGGRGGGGNKSRVDW